jgi:hypothetical protein
MRRSAVGLSQWANESDESVEHRLGIFERTYFPYPAVHLRPDPVERYTVLCSLCGPVHIPLCA